MARLVLSYKHVITSYGAKTLSGHGGIAVPAGAASITDAGGTNLTISSGFVVPASNGVTKGIVTFDNGVTWEIRPVANAYSVRTHAQLLVTLRLTALAYGDQVLLRGGTYDDTEVNLGSNRIRRDAPPLGTFVPPSRYGASGTSDWYRGPNLDTGNYVVVKPHNDTPFTETVGAGRSRTITAKGADSPTLGMIDVDGDGVNERGFRFHGLRFAGRKGLIFRGACLDMAADRCHFENEDPIPSWDTWSGSTPPEFGAHRIYVLNGGCTNIAVLDNLIEGGGYGVRLAGTNDGYAVVGNWARGMWIDSFQMGAGANTLIAWNISDDKKDGPTEATLHGDHFQWNNYGDDTVVVGNIAWRGEGYTARPDGQGIFLSDAPSAMSGLVIAGNIAATSFVRGISLDLGDAPTIVGNMALDPLATSTLATVIWNADAANSGGWVAGNIGEAISANSTATLSGNVTLPSSKYADVFVNPDFALDPWVDLSAWLAGFTTKAGGPLDITPTKNPIGASWINYATRTFDPAILERGSVEDAIIISDPVPVLSAFGAGSIDDLELDPPAIFIEHNIGGTLTGDFHSSATPPAKEAGDIGFFTTSLSGDAVTDISTALNSFFALHPAETGYMHFRLTNGTDSNVITTQQITTAAVVPSAFVDANWSVATGSGSGELDVTITTLPANGGASITDVEYDLDASGTWISSGGTVSFTISGLTASTSYAVRLRAVNSAGNGAAGNSESATSGAAGGFDPASLFGGSDDGFFYDFSDTSTLWQDTAATSAVTADGQSIARVDDKSGKGHNATQSTAGNRPLYKTSGGLHWALSDGTDFMDASLALTSANVYVCIAFKPVSTNAYGRIFSLGEVGGNDFDSRSFCAVHRDDSTTSWLANRLNNTTPKVTIANGTAGVFEGVFESANTSAVLDGGTPVSAAPGGSGNFATITARIFSYLANSAFGANAEVAAILVINRIPDSTERANLVTWMAAKQGRSI